MSQISQFCRVVAAMVFLATVSAGVVASDATPLIQQFCVDCHGAADTAPEGDFSLSADFGKESIGRVGPTLKKALDAIEGFEMPPADADQPTANERNRLSAEIRRLLSQPSLGGHADPGRPVIRRLTRLEYNNTIRDLFGLETDAFVFSERLPFSRHHYDPKMSDVPDRLLMSAREYGSKYAVLLPDASLPGDSRAGYGFANRGDAQNLSAVRLQQYIDLAGQIAFHPELLSRAERMQELFPQARFRQLAGAAQRKPKPLVASVKQLAANGNVVRTVADSDFELDQFRERISAAFAEDRGGVFVGESLPNTTIAGKGGLLRISYGKNAIRTFAVNPNEDWWFAPFATADETSGGVLFANYRKQQRTYELTFQADGRSPFAGIAEAGLVLLSRKGQSGTVLLTATFDDDTTKQISVTLKPGSGTDNTFVAFAAPQDRTIKKLKVDGSAFSGDYVLLDDLAFITLDTPNNQPLVQVEEPDVQTPDVAPRSELLLNRSLAKGATPDRIAHFLRRAFRREVSAAEIQTYLKLYEASRKSGGSDEAAMRAALQAILASPSFLYVNLTAEAAASPSGAEESSEVDEVQRLSDYSLASRLSYFLWSSMPDDELLALAASGELQNESILKQQVQRMLHDPRSIELPENFFVAWLRLQELWSAQPDQKRFSEFYAGAKGKRTLARDMFAEVLLLFETILTEDRSVTELLDADYTFINSKLADFYRSSSRTDSDASDIRYVTYSGGQALAAAALEDDRVWYRVRRFDPNRGGVISSPAVLTLTSFPHRTSSIRRGVWLLDTIFNRHPPAPKVAVADIEEQENSGLLTLRQKVERHRRDPACAACHDRIDPPGFALENFDPIGRWRQNEGDELIDASGHLSGAGAFTNPVEFKQLLLSQKRRFVQGLTEHLMSYALGRKLEYFDTPAVEAVVDRTLDADGRLSTMIIEIVRSFPFRNCRGLDRSPLSNPSNN